MIKNLIILSGVFAVLLQNNKLERMENEYISVKIFFIKPAWTLNQSLHIYINNKKLDVQINAGEEVIIKLKKSHKYEIYTKRILQLAFSLPNNSKPKSNSLIIKDGKVKDIKVDDKDIKVDDKDIKVKDIKVKDKKVDDKDIIYMNIKLEQNLWQSIYILKEVDEATYMKNME